MRFGGGRGLTGRSSPGWAYQGLPRRSCPGLLSVTLLFCSLLAGAFFALGAAIPERARYVTWEGIGPDKWGAVWLIKRRIDPDADVVFLPVSSVIEEGVAFDIPGAVFQRTGSSTTFDSLLRAHDIDDEAILGLGKFINDIEVNAWSIGARSDAAPVEAAFRDLQRRYGRVGVPFPCYMRFFDNVYTALVGATGAAPSDGSALVPGPECETGTETAAAGEALVAELPVKTVLARLAAGQDVVFVDTREAGEYEEFHIPGAVHLMLHEVDRAAAERFADADLVVPYCVKDFRGYEVARALRKVGVTNVAILNPYGIKGWRTVGLPVAGSVALPEEDAAKALDACARDTEKCLRKL